MPGPTGPSACVSEGRRAPAPRSPALFPEEGSDLGIVDRARMAAPLGGGPSLSEGGARMRGSESRDKRRPHHGAWVPEGQRRALGQEWLTQRNGRQAAD